MCDLGLQGGDIRRVYDTMKGHYPLFARVSEKIRDNTEWQGQQALLWIEPGTSRLPALRAEPLSHWWGFKSRGHIMSVLRGLCRMILILFFCDKLK